MTLLFYQGVGFGLAVCLSDNGLEWNVVASQSPAKCEAMVAGGLPRQLSTMAKGDMMCNVVVSQSLAMVRVRGSLFRLGSRRRRRIMHKLISRSVK